MNHIGLKMRHYDIQSFLDNTHPMHGMGINFCLETNSD